MINILICDDEQSYQEILDFKIKKLFDEQLKTEVNIKLVSSIEDVEYCLTNENIDIAFIDIMLNDVNTVNLFADSDSLNENNTELIFMTSFPIESYRLSETTFCYFLIKPKLTDEMLLKAIKKAINNITKKSSNLQIIQIGSKNLVINYQEIAFVETFNNNITIHMLDGESYTIYSTLKQFATSLTPNFLRCHKSYMINMNHIKAYEPHKFILSDNSSIPIPPKKYTEIVGFYRNYLFSL